MACLVLGSNCALFHAEKETALDGETHSAYREVFGSDRPAHIVREVSTSEDLQGWVDLKGWKCATACIMMFRILGVQGKGEFEFIKRYCIFGDIMVAIPALAALLFPFIRFFLCLLAGIQVALLT